jgi:hypothetical protein
MTHLIKKFSSLTQMDLLSGKTSYYQDFNELIHYVYGTYIYENDFINLKKTLDDFQVELKKLVEKLNWILY